VRARLRTGLPDLPPRRPNTAGGNDSADTVRIFTKQF